MNWFRVIIIGIVVISTFGFVVYQVLQFFFSINVSSSKFRKDVDRFRSELAGVKENLILVDSESLRLLSFDKEEDFFQDKISIYKEGVFTSIYHEPMIAYAYKQYLTRMDKAVLLAETQEDSYEYYISERSTRVVKNNTPYGVVHGNGDLLDMDGTVIANIQIADKNILPITISEKPIAMLNNPHRNTSGLSRAFDLIDTDSINENEAIIILSVLLAVQGD